MAEETQSFTFAIKDCALAAIATGCRAQNLRELRDQLATIHHGSIYYHFWGELLRPKFVDLEHINDFAGWARSALHDGRLAERLAVIDPTEYPDIDDLRKELIEVIEERLDESEIVPWCSPDEQFHFMRSQIVVFDTHVRLETPRELAKILPTISPSSIFYHFIDGRRREPVGLDDFRYWIQNFGSEYEALDAQLAEVDPSFESLTRLRTQLANVFENFFKGGDS